MSAPGPAVNRPRSPVALIAAIGIALAALIILNVAQNRLDPKVQERLAEEAQSKAAAEAEKKAAERAAAGSGGAANPERANTLVTLGPVATFGPSAARVIVTIVWEWTPAVQGNPGAVTDLAGQIVQEIPGVSVELVNTEQSDGREPGIYIQNHLAIDPEPSGVYDADSVIQRLKAMPEIPKMPAGPSGGPPEGRRLPPPPP